MLNQVSEGYNHQSTARLYGQERIFFHGEKYQDDHWWNGITNTTDHGRNSEEDWGLGPNQYLPNDFILWYVLKIIDLSSE